MPTGWYKCAAAGSAAPLHFHAPRCSSLLQGEHGIKVYRWEEVPRYVRVGTDTVLYQAAIPQGAKVVQDVHCVHVSHVTLHTPVPIPMTVYEHAVHLIPSRLEALYKCVDRDAFLKLAGIAVARDGMALRHTVYAQALADADPDRWRSTCWSAVRQNPYALAYVWEQRQALVECALRADGGALHVVNTPTFGQCVTAVRTTPSALRAALRSFHSEVLCHVAVQRDGMAIQYVPDSLRTKELCERAVRQCPEAARWITQQEA